MRVFQCNGAARPGGAPSVIKPRLSMSQESPNLGQTDERPHNCFGAQTVGDEQCNTLQHRQDRRNALVRGSEPVPVLRPGLRRAVCMWEWWARASRGLSAALPLRARLRVTGPRAAHGGRPGRRREGISVLRAGQIAAC